MSKLPSPLIKQKSQRFYSATCLFSFFSLNRHAWNQHHTSSTFPANQKRSGSFLWPPPTRVYFCLDVNTNRFFCEIKLTDPPWAKEQLIRFWRPQSTFPATTSLFLFSCTSDMFQIFWACLQCREINVNSKWRERLSNGKLGICFLWSAFQLFVLLLICLAPTVCSTFSLFSLPLVSTYIKTKPLAKYTPVHVSLKLGDRAVVTGISNTSQQLNWLCQPLSINNVQVQSFIRGINLLSFSGVWWGCDLVPVSLTFTFSCLSYCTLLFGFRRPCSHTQLVFLEHICTDTIDKLKSNYLARKNTKHSNCCFFNMTIYLFSTFISL